MKLRKLISILLVMLILSSLLSSFSIGAEGEPSYREYSEKLGDEQGKDICLSIADAVFSEDEVGRYEEYDGSSALVFENKGGFADIPFVCEETGRYTVKFEYFPIQHKRINIEVGIKIDGEYLYSDMKSFFLSRAYKNDGDIKTDSQGNDYNPQQVEENTWLTSYFCSSGGNYDSPMELYIEKGEHTFSLLSLQEPFAVCSIVLKAQKELISYEDYSKLYADNSADFSEKIEAENVSLKSNPSLLAKTDRTSIKTSPFSYTNQKLNIIGGESFSSVGQWLCYDVDVPENGYYYIDFRYSQSYNQGLPSNRRLYINDEVPFKEADNLKFTYEPDWGSYSLKVNGEKVKYYLKKGKNTIKLEVTLGDVVKVAMRLDDIVFLLNEYYRKMVMITGSSPDKYRDYNLESEVPNLLETFADVSKELKEIEKQVADMTSGKGNSGNILKVLAYQLDGMIKNPSGIPYRLNSLSSNIGSLSSWSLEIKSQALDLDYFIVSKEKCEVEKNENFFETVKREFLYFIYSFTIDYNSMGTGEYKNSISVWINTGRDQANILRRMTDDMFTPQEGISVSIKLTSANAIQAFLSGNAPDVMLNIARGLPVNLALRGALYDLTKFSDFDDVKSQFSATATDPFKIDDRVYGLPETETYYMLFTRDDVLKDLGIGKPETWDDFYESLQILQLNGLYVGVPYAGVDSSAAVDSGIGSKNLFSAFLLQAGGSFYDEKNTTTNLSDATAVSAFEKWTDLYAKFGLPLSYNFFNRFRTGEMPMGIALYTEYNQLKAAAPEISGLWSMSPIPGTKKEDGSIDRSQGGSGTSCVMTSTTKNPEAAWKFLKWWTGTEAQTRYGTDLESVMGVAARYPTANIEAMSNQQWTTAEYNTLIAQSEFVSEIPVIAGSYYLTRGIDNAFRETVYDGRNAKESLIVWNKEIADEIARKREEFFDEK